MSRHAAVWLDHREARVFHLDGEGFDETKLDAPHHVFRHPRPQGDKHHPEEEHKFFQEIAASLAKDEEILVVGPSTAKLHFVRYLHQHDRPLETRLVGIETVDHPTDKQIVAYVRSYFDKVIHGSGQPGD